MWAIYQKQKHLSKSKLMEKQSQYDLEAENKRLGFFSILIDKSLKSIHAFLYS